MTTPNHPKAAKQLRLGVSCFGGTSLAVYMHGITREIQKLVKASRQLYGNNPAQPVDTAAAPDSGTERVYFRLLQELRDKFHSPLDVIVDIIAGSSAGGIDAVFLAKALVGDLSQAQLSEVWIKRASLFKLLNPGLLLLKPPLSGDRFFKWLFAALEAMETPAAPAASLLPENHSLDLFITMTDTAGYRQFLPISGEPRHGITELKHDHVMHLQYNRGQVNHFTREYNPLLAFAARATASLPVVMKAAVLKDLPRLCRPRRCCYRKWSARPYDPAGCAYSTCRYKTCRYKKHHRPHKTGDFQAEFFPLYRQTAAVSEFIDGGTLNNRPTEQVIAAVAGKTAAAVPLDRRIVYINPVAPVKKNAARRPGKKSMLSQLGSLLQLFRYEPVAADLAQLTELNQRISRANELIPLCMEQIKDQTLQILAAHGSSAESGKKALNLRAAENINYPAYLRLKIHACLEYLIEGICKICGYPSTAVEYHFISEVIFQNSRASLLPRQTAGITPAQLQFLNRFDLPYRMRKIRFVIRGLDNFARQLTVSSAGQPVPETVLKTIHTTRQTLYRILAELSALLPAALCNPRLHENPVFAGIAGLFSREKMQTYLPGSFPGEAAAGFRLFLEKYRSAIEECLSKLADSLQTSLDQIYRRDDYRLMKGLLDLTATGLSVSWAKELHSLQEELQTLYWGFPLWDLVVFPVQKLGGGGEMDPIELYRINPEKTAFLKPPQPERKIRGSRLMNLYAFFSRRFRENDYLWGRLDGAEQLIRLVMESALGAQPGPQAAVYCYRAFRAILAEEQPRLKTCGKLIKSLLRELPPEE